MMRRSIIITAVSLLLSLAVSAAWAQTVDGVPYIKADGTPGVADGVNVVTSLELVAGTYSLGDPGTVSWHVLRGAPETFNEWIKVLGTVHLILENGCDWAFSDYINLWGGGSLTIYAQSAAKGTMGKLTASNIFTGSGGIVTINGGEVKATGDMAAAGIGGCSGGSITINGGEVLATGGRWSAGIGKGNNCGSGDDITITINGGKVTARGVDGGAGIGSGSRSSGGIITISGGEVTAIGNGGGAGIGGGWAGYGYKDSYGDDNFAVRNGGNITISGGKVTAISGAVTDGKGGAGIGGGAHGDGGNITISGGEVKATGDMGAAGIGGGASGGYGSAFRNTDIGVITISGGEVTANGGGFGCAGIGGGWENSWGWEGGGGGRITITGNSKVTADGDVGIGVYLYNNHSERKNIISIEGGTITATGDYSGISGNPVTISGGTITATGGSDGISGNDIFIVGSMITATGRRSDGISGNNISIGGGNMITATGGSDGIRGGNISIGGGTITATGENDGISSSNITIGGGTITATGGSYGISGSYITIDGGSIKATGCGGYDDYCDGNIRGRLRNQNGNEVWLNTLTAAGQANKKVSNISGSFDYDYGTTNVMTDSEGKLYFYLPAGTCEAITVVIDGTTYVTNEYCREDNHDNAQDLKNPLTSVLANDNRVLPQNDKKDASVVAPAAYLSAEFTAGPNPVLKSTGRIGFYRQGKRVDNGTLSIYDASGNFIRKINIRDAGALRATPAASTAVQSRRQVGSWDLRDGKGRMVGEGTYVVKGVLKSGDGKSEKVSMVLGVR